jgi:hypothetical protein
VSQVLDEAKLRGIAQRLRNSTRFQEIVRCQLTGPQALEVVAMAHGYGSWAQLQAALRDSREATPAAETAPAGTDADAVEPRAAMAGAQALEVVRAQICKPIQVWLGRARAQGRTVWIGFDEHRIELDALIVSIEADSVPPEWRAMLKNPQAQRPSLERLCIALRDLAESGWVMAVPRMVEPSS